MPRTPSTDASIPSTDSSIDTPWDEEKIETGDYVRFVRTVGRPGQVGSYTHREAGYVQGIEGDIVAVYLHSSNRQVAVNREDCTLIAKQYRIPGV